MKKVIKFWLLPVIAVVLMVSFASCGGDEPAKYSNYYIECTNVSGGGFSSQECASLKASFNTDIADWVLENQTKTEAINVFNRFIDELARDFSSFTSDKPLKITFALKTLQGTKVKERTITITSDGTNVTRTIE